MSSHTTTEFHLALSSGSLGAAVDEPSDARRPCPVVVLLAGSGPTDHNGDNPLLPTPVGNLRQIGEALAERGIASIRPAKRGISLSAADAPPEAEMTIDRLVDDAVAWVEFATSDGRWSPVILTGHSEGALIAAAAAERTEIDGYISLAGTADRAGDILRAQLRRQLPDDLMSAADHAIGLLEAGRLVDDPAPALSALFRPSVQPYLISWFALDPAKIIASLAVPTLILHGTDDAQVPSGDAARLAASRGDATPVVLDDVDHLLVTTGTHTIDPRVIDEVVRFVESLVT
ncbi:MAG: alpha/beta fold hydrolase [Ilumatobacteraceae bacterium]